MENVSLIKLPKDVYFEKDMLYDISSYVVVHEPQLHWHEFYEIEYVVSGKAQQIINGKTYDIGPGYATLISPIDFHTYKNISPESPITVINIKFQDLFLPQQLRNDIYVQKRAKVAKLTDERFGMFMQYLCEEFDKNEYCRDWVIMNGVTQLCVWVMRHILSSEEKELADKVHSPIQEAVLYVRTHFRSNISAEAVAKTVHLSPNYFSEYFKKQTGEKFSLFVLRLRIDFAANLLKISDLSVKEVAFESGFNSAAYFSNTFKDFYGMSPDRYRKENKPYSQLF